MTWFVLGVILFSMITGKLRYDLTAFGGLLLLGFLGIRSPSQLFSGFSSPALFTIVSVLVMSAGIVESGLLAGLGKKIAARIHDPGQQILAVFFSTGMISAFMNNVGAVGIILPTAKRMATRANVPQYKFGIPIAYAAVLGGSLTLIGTASNLIVSAYRQSAFGQPFRMFDFAAHGLFMLISGLFVVWVCHGSSCRLAGGENRENSDPFKHKPRDLATQATSRHPKKSLLVLLTLLPAVILSGFGILHPSVAFGAISLVWLSMGVFSYKSALEHVNFPIILFLGSMFSIASILDETGALNAAVNLLSPVLTQIPPFPMILVFLLVTALFANILDNSVAALLMAPFATALWKSGAITINPDALLMAVAAGASLGLVVPSHQATMVVMESMEFPRKAFIKTGAAICTAAALLSACVIWIVWC